MLSFHGLPGVGRRSRTGIDWRDPSNQPSDPSNYHQRTEGRKPNDSSSAVSILIRTYFRRNFSNLPNFGTCAKRRQHGEETVGAPRVFRT